LAVIGIFVEDSNDRSTGGLNKTRNSANDQCLDKFITNARNISLVIGSFNQAKVSTFQASISSTTCVIVSW
jgi:hypothetical protein